MNRFKDLLSEVVIIGVGMAKFGKFPDRPVADIGQEAVVEALKDAQIDKKEIEAAYCGTARAGRIVGQRILKDIGLTRIPIVNNENACSSGATAFREACIAVGAGLYDTALVIGVERLSKIVKGVIPLDRDDVEVNQGLTMPALYAMRAQRYMHDYSLTREQLALVAVKSRKNAALNPKSQFQEPVTVEQVLNSRMVADPFTLLMCCPNGDGAAAAIICRKDKAAKYTTKPIFVRSSVLNSGYYETGFRDMTSPEITVRAAREAYETAGLGPEDISIAEVHDAFVISELLYYEALGFCGRGEAGKLITEGQTEINGRIPVNTDGGLLSKGHPLGATGVSQIAEVVWQLRNQAGPRQVNNPRVGLTHCTGGGLSGLDHGACTINILSL